MRRIVLIFVQTALMISLSAAADATPVTVVNNSFELGTFVNDGTGTMILPVGSTTMTGWTVIGDELAWIISPNSWALSAQDGNRFLDFTAFPTGAPFGGVQQTLATVVGDLYQVNYFLGTYTQRWGGPPVSIQASAGGTDQVCTVNQPSSQSTWTLCSMSFIAASTSTALSFLGTAGVQYIGLDNVSVEDLGPTTLPQVPEPTSMTLLGSGLLVAARAASRRREKA
jgi:hypothetical protein